MLRYLRLLVVVVSILSVTFIIYLSTLLMNILNEKQNTKLLQNPLIHDTVMSVGSDSEPAESQIPHERTITHPHLRLEHPISDWRVRKYVVNADE